MELRRAPTACYAVVDNWTACAAAFAGDDAYAYANDTLSDIQAVQTTTHGDQADTWNFDHTVPTGTDRFLLLTVSTEGGNDVMPTPRFGSQTFTMVWNHLHTFGGPRVVVFGLLDPAEGTHSVTGNLTSTDRFALAAVSFTGVNGSMPMDWITSEEGVLEDSMTVVVPSQVGDLVVDATANLGFEVPTVGPGQTELYNLEMGENDTFGNRATGSYEPGASPSVAMTWHNKEPGMEWVSVGMNLKPGTSAGRNDTAWRNFDLVLDPEDVVESLEVGVEWFRTNPIPVLNVSVSWDGGNSWAPFQTAKAKSVDDDTVEWLDFSGATDWDATRLSNANFRVRATANASGARLDQVAVRASYNDAPHVSDFRLEDGAGSSLAGERLDLDVEYRFRFTVEDRDGWSDIADDGDVTLWLWYDGNASPELTYSQQVNGSDHRIALRYVDTGDPGNASLAEWSVAEGSAVYNASASSLTPIQGADRVVGYRFELALRFGLTLAPTPDPADDTPGSYNDAGSWNAMVTAFDGAIVTSRAETPSGAWMEFGLFPVPQPAFSPALRLDRKTVEKGDEVVATFHYNNTGRGTAPWAWANWSLMDHYALLSIEEPVVPEETTDGFAVPLADVDPGTHRMRVHLRVIRGMDDGRTLVLSVGWQASDSDGNPLPPVDRAASAILQAPAAAVTLEALRGEVNASSPFLLRAMVRNTGSAPAAGWLNLTLPAGVAFEGDNVSELERAVLEDRVSWIVPTLAPGEAVFLEIQLRAPSAGGEESFRATFAYHDGRGSPPDTEASGVALVQFVPTGLSLPPWSFWLFGLLLAAVGGVTALAWLRRRGEGATVEEVFVVDRGGTLLAHRSRTILQEQDEDLVVAMFTAIQEYIRNVFSKGTEERIRSLEFGERKILIEPGRHHYVAVVFRGRDGGTLERDLQEVSQAIDDQFGDILADWSGDTERVGGIALLLPRVWKSRRS